MTQSLAKALQVTMQCAINTDCMNVKCVGSGSYQMLIKRFGITALLGHLCHSIYLLPV